MQRLEEDVSHDSQSPLSIDVHSLEFIETEALASDDAEPAVAEGRSDHTDDPVRVYLREMGSVRLLTKQAEIDLAQRMERGSLRAKKALSRSLMIRKLALARYRDTLENKANLEDLVQVAGADEAAKRRSRNKSAQ